MKTGAPLEHRADPARPGHPPEPEGARPRIVAGPLGPRPVVGEGHVSRRQDDQREVGDGGREARVPRRAEIPQVPDSYLWKDTSGTWVETCSILTTVPNSVTLAVHDRMPVILDPGCYDLWLDPGMGDAGAACELLKPWDARLMRCYPVSARINRVANGDVGCSAPVELAQIQNRNLAQLKILVCRKRCGICGQSPNPSGSSS